MDENKPNKIEEFEASLNAGNSADFLSQSVVQFSTLAESMKAMIVQSKRITDWPEYQTHLPVFLELNQKYVDWSTLFGVLGFDFKTAIEQYLAQAVQQGGKLNASDLMNDLIQRGKQASLNDFNKAFGYDLKELDNIKRTLKNHEDVMNNLRNINHPASKRMLLEGLYKDSVEVYLKTLREIYSRVKDSDNYGNEEMYGFFREHPPLWDSPMNDPRNDFSHRTFEVYDAWSDDDLHRGANVILVRALTGMIAKCVYLANLFKQVVATVSLGLKELDKSKTDQKDETSPSR